MMFFIWGKKEVVRRLGYVADFCPLCRDVRTFEIKRIGLAGHIYYITVSQGEFVAYCRTCTACGTEMDAPAETYKRLSDEPLTTAQLLPLTFPNLAEHHAARLALEKMLGQPFTRLPQQDRLALIREPLVLLSPKVEKRFASLHIDWPTGLAMLGAMAALAYVPAALAEKWPAYHQEILVACVLAGIAATAVQILRASERYIRREIFPVLVPALHPLKPTPDELGAALQERRKLGLKIGGKIEPQWLIAALRQHALPKVRQKN